MVYLLCLVAVPVVRLVNRPRTDMGPCSGTKITVASARCVNGLLGNGGPAETGIQLERRISWEDVPSLMLGSWNRFHVYTVLHRFIHY